MQEDNLYPISGAYYAEEPAEQKQERDQERDQILANAPQIQDAIDSLRAASELYDSVRAIEPEFFTDPEKFMHVVAGNKLASEILRNEADKLDVYLKAYTEE